MYKSADFDEETTKKKPLLQAKAEVEERESIICFAHR